MAGIDKITEKIRQDAHDEAANILREAEQTAAQQSASFLEQTRLQKERILQNAQKHADEILRTAQSSATQASRNSLLTLRRELVNEALKRALNMLIHLPDPEYFSLCANLILKNAMPGEGILMLNAKDHARLPAQFLQQVNTQLSDHQRIVLSADTVKTDGGFYIVYNDIEINCTFSSLIRSDRERLEDIAAGILFA